MKVQPIRSYRAAPGAQYNHDQAQEIGTFLEKHPSWPSITTEEAVEAAEPPDSPLHPFIEWDNDKAAAQYRKQQARHLLNHLIIREAGEDRKAFHNVSPPAAGERRQYLHIDKVRMSPEDAGEVIADALAQLEGWLERHNRYARQLGPLFGSVEQAVLSYRESKQSA